MKQERANQIYDEAEAILKSLGLPYNPHQRRGIIGFEIPKYCRPSRTEDKEKQERFFQAVGQLRAYAESNNLRFTTPRSKEGNVLFLLSGRKLKSRKLEAITN